MILDLKQALLAHQVHCEDDLLKTKIAFCLIVLESVGMTPAKDQSSSRDASSRPRRALCFFRQASNRMTALATGVME